MRDKPKAWHLGYAGALISQEREYKALREVKNMKVSLGHSHSPDLIVCQREPIGLCIYVDGAFEIMHAIWVSPHMASDHLYSCHAIHSQMGVV